MAIIIKNVLIEVHQFIGMVKHYHGLLQKIYSIITTEIPSIQPDLALQMFFKVINHLLDPNGLVLILLIFGIYLMITEQDTTFLSKIKHAMAIQKAMDKDRKNITTRQVNDVLNIYNELSTRPIYDIYINSLILSYRKGNTGQLGEWQRLYNLLNIQNE